MKSGRRQNHSLILIFVFTILNTIAVFAGPSRTTYQAKIVKPDGYPLEASSVNFKFTILDPAGTCILYSETYSSVNMSGTGGLISFSLGSGVKTYPTSATTFEQVFSNITPNLSCDVGGPADYTPSASDIRKIVMQFHDGAGWQTLPAMSINAVPYAMYANEATKLNGLTSSDFVQVSTVPTCAASEALRYTGTGFTCVAVGNSVTSGTVVTALGYTPADSASLTTVTSDLSTVSSTVAGVSVYASSVSSTVTSLQSSVAASFAAITSSQWTTSGTNIFYNTGRIGIGITTPVTKLDVSGGVRIGAETTTCAPALAGTLRYNASNVEYCNGTTWQAFGVSGAGITNFNGSTSSTQSLAIGTGGTAPNIVTANGVHTLNIPLASTGAVTAGLISNADYTTFSNKITSSAASIAQVLGYVPADNSASGTYAQRANNLSDLTNVATARTNLGLGTFATANTIDLGGASATGTLAVARLPSFTGDATIAAASNTIILANSGVTAGTYTKVIVDVKGRVTSGAQITSSEVTTALGYTPASATSLSSYLVKANNLSDLASSATARTNLGVGYIGTLSSVDLGSADVSGTLAIARTPAYAGDVTKAAASNTLILSNTGVAAGTYTKVTVDVKGRVISSSALAVSDVTTALGYTPASATASTQWTTSGTAIYYNIGNVGIGTGSATPITKLDVAGGLRISMEAATCAASYAGTLRYTGGNIEYCNGSAWAAFGVATAGINALNGSASQTQTFANGTAGTAPAFVTANGVHTLNIPLASAGSVTAGLISNADYTSFANKITSSAAAISQVLGYAPVSTTTLGNYVLKTNNLSDLTSSATARTNLGLGTFATANTIDLGSASATGTMAAARMPELQGDVDSVSGSVTTTVVGLRGRSVASTAPASGQVLSYNGTSWAPATNTSSQWLTSGSTISYSSGNVGIGTTAPTYKLHVAGDIGVQDIYSSQGQFDIVNSSGVGLSIVGAPGNVGIGTSAPTSRLHLSDNNAVILTVDRSNNQNSLIEYKNTLGSMYAGLISGTSNWGVGTGNDLAASGVFTVTNAGRVYIGGTAQPTARLHIAAGTSSLASVKFTSGTLLSSPQSGTIEYDGTDFYITDGNNNRRTIATASTAGTLDNVTVVSSPSGIALWPAAGNSVTVSATTASTNSSTGALIVKGGMGIAGNLYSSGTIMTSSNIQGASITATSGLITPYIYGSTAASGDLYINSTTHATKGDLILMNQGGKVGIGTATPGAWLQVSGTGTTGTWGSFSATSGGYVRVTEGGSLNLNIDGNSIIADNSLSIATTGASTMQFGTSNTERIRIDSSGNVGIGTTAPSQKLHVNNGNIELSANYGMGYLMGSATSERSLYPAYTGFNTMAGLGPSAPYNLGILLKSDEMIAFAETDSDGIIGYMDVNAKNFIWDGNIGIGTTSPSYKLHVNGHISSSNGNIHTNRGRIAFSSTPTDFNHTIYNNYNDLDGEGIWDGMKMNVYQGLSVRLGQSNSATPTTAFHINSTGNVGIGTSTPLSKLDVANATIRALDSVTQYAPSGGRGLELLSLNGTGYIFTYDRTTPTYLPLRIDGSSVAIGNSGTTVLNVTGGSVGIGVTPSTSYKLDVLGDIYVGSGGSSQTIRFRTANTDGGFIRFNSTADAAGGSSLEIGTTDNSDEPILFTQTATERMRIHTNGYLGIGTASPQRSLHVNGDAYINSIVGGQNNGSGNFHLDAWSSGADRSVYLNWSSGTGGAKVGNGSSTWGPISASAFNTSSDKRLKENIKPIENSLDKILKIDAVTFTWKDASRHKMEGERLGLIAQNVEQIFPQAVKVDRGENTLPGGTKLVTYPDLVAPLIAALKEFYSLWWSDSQELHKTIESQKREMASIKEEKEQQSQEIEMLKTKSSQLEEQNKALKDYLCEKDPNAKICK